MVLPFPEVGKNVRKINGIKSSISVMWGLKCILEVQMRYWVYKSGSNWEMGEAKVGILIVTCI